MIGYYEWPWAVRSAITLLFAVCVLLQTLAVVSGFYRRRPVRLRFFESFLEVSILCQILISSMLHGQAIQAFEAGFIPPTGYADLRIVVFALTVLFALIVAFSSLKFWPLLLIPAAGITLPFVEALLGRAFVYFFLLALLFWLVRSVLICRLRIGDIRTSLSSLSIKNAIDSLHTGVMFCEEDGFILLANTQMLQLMVTITGKIQRNGRHFFGLLTLGDIDSNCQTTWLEGQNVIIMPDGTAWMFTTTELKIKKRKYTQLTAADITERWKLATELQPQNEELMRRQNELSEAIASLHVLSRERETQRAKMRTHDILGERLTLLLKTIRSEKEPDYAMLRFLSKGLIDEIKSVGNAPSPQDELDNLKQVFQSIGVEILVEGAMPADNAKGQLIAEIAREAVTNAVRHGLATRVRIEMSTPDRGFLLRITNNGHPPDSLKEGGGISGMRKKVRPFGGRLRISIHPRFVLAVNLPDSGETSAAGEE